MLIGEPTVAAMAEAFQRTKDISLPERLIAVLEAGQAGGGDKRGRQSAAVKVYYKEEFPYLDLRVDEHRHPVAELRRVFEVARHQLLPFVDGMPSRKNPLGDLPEALRKRCSSRRPSVPAVAARRRELRRSPTAMSAWALLGLKSGDEVQGFGDSRDVPGDSPSHMKHVADAAPAALELAALESSGSPAATDRRAIMRS